jgi:tRNA(fMet)-specific endonuclease VapC
MTFGGQVMPKSLIDTDILSEYLRGKNTNVAQRAEAYLREHGRFSLSVLTVFEIVRGRHQASQIERATQFLTWAGGTELVPFDVECARLGGEIAGALQRNGTTVGVADTLIAATAIRHKLTLVTGNVDHFQRMVEFGLPIDNWRQ